MVVRQFLHADGRLSYAVVDTSTQDAMLVDPPPGAVSSFQEVLIELGARLLCVVETSGQTTPWPWSGPRVGIEAEQGDRVHLLAFGNLVTLQAEGHGGPRRAILPGSSAMGIQDVLLLQIGRSFFEMIYSGGRLLLFGDGRVFGADLRAAGGELPRAYADLPEDTLVFPRRSAGWVRVSTVGQEISWGWDWPSNEPERIVTPRPVARRQTTPREIVLPDDQDIEAVIRSYPPRSGNDPRRKR